MNNREKCELIIKRMIESSFDFIDEPVDGWNDEDCEYFVLNYENQYINNWNK